MLKRSLFLASVLFLPFSVLGDSSVQNSPQDLWTSHTVTPESDLKDVQKWCDDVNGAIKALHWDVADVCKQNIWKIGGRSVEGRPLVYAEFGQQNAKNTTLIFSMVHPDEITPLYLGLKITEWLESNIGRFPSTRVVIAPFVNPDGFFRASKTRVNSRGVDLNRNFATKDWHTNAIQRWKKHFASNPRRFPGTAAESEPETVFQRKLIEQTLPEKILSFHAPLNFMDYDGPNVLSLNKFPREYVRKCLQLRKQVRAVSGGFFPGSLGNFAGQERGIPTLTLELPTANPKMAQKYWLQFMKGIHTVIQFDVPQIQGFTIPDASQQTARNN